MDQYGYFFTNMTYSSEITPVCSHLNMRQVEFFGAYLGGWPDFYLERVIYSPPYAKKLIEYSDFSKENKITFEDLIKSLEIIAFLLEKRGYRGALQGPPRIILWRLAFSMPTQQ